jgi:hypothetical protein
MFRIVLFAVSALYVIAVGIWPPAVAPLALAFAGLAVIGGLVPGYVWALAAGAAWLKYRPASAVTA